MLRSSLFVVSWSFCRLKLPWVLPITKDREIAASISFNMVASTLLQGHVVFGIAIAVFIAVCTLSDRADQFLFIAFVGYY